MVRTALQPRWLALLALALVVASVCAALGDWQLGRAQRDSDRVVVQEPVPISDVAAPASQLGEEAGRGPVTASGAWVPDDALRVLDQRDPADPERLGQWVVVPLEVPATASDGGPARLAVVLGWAADASAADAAVASLPVGDVDVVGRLQLSQEVSDPPEPLADDELWSLSAADLTNRWSTPLWSGYLVSADAPPGLTAVPVAEAEPGLHLVNLSYALQWWVFAAFFVFLWWRVVRDAHERELEAAAAAEPAPGETGAVEERV